MPTKAHQCLEPVEKIGNPALHFFSAVSKCLQIPSPKSVSCLPSGKFIVKSWHSLCPSSRNAQAKEKVPVLLLNALDSHMMLY